MVFSKPQAYLKLQIFDENGVFLSEKKQIISENALNAWETLSLGTSIPQNGKIKVFLVNETEQETYFDELEIVISNKPTTKIVQENNYYPFGLNMRGLEKVGSPDDKFQYNAQTEKDEDIEMYETPFRGYDTQLGRFHQVDLLAPMFPSITPYHFGYNNPVYFNDPSGLVANASSNDNNAWQNLINQIKTGDISNIQAGTYQNPNSGGGENTDPLSGKDNFLQDKKPNSIAIFVSNLKPVDRLGTKQGMAEKVDQPANSNWNTEIVSSFEEIPSIIQAYSLERPIDNLVIFTHGSSGMFPAILSGNDETRNINYNNLDNSPDVKALRKTLQFMGTNANIVFAACYTAWWGDQFPLALKNKLLAGYPLANINMYFSVGKIEFTFTKIGTEQYAYQLMLDQAITTSKNWKQTNPFYDSTTKSIEAITLKRNGNISFKK